MVTGKQQISLPGYRPKNARGLLLFVLFWPLFFFARGNDPFTVKEHLYQIDHVRKLIVINQKSGQIDAQWTKPRTSLMLDEQYYFAQVFNTIENGIAYKVVNSDDISYTLYFTQLPLVHISTSYEIVDEPRVPAEFLLSESSGNTLHANIGIEYRGGWIQSYPKKSFRIEFWEDKSGRTTKDVSMLGMRNDDDWNLQAMYNEPLRIRSKTSNELWKLFHTVYYHNQESDAVNGIEMKYVELFLNGRYYGVYALSERVDRKQLQLKKYNDKMRGELYKGVSWGAPTFSSLPDFNNQDIYWEGFEFKYPEEVTDWINLYGFVDFVMNATNHYFFQTYPVMFEKNNAVDYFIFLNLSRATDNTGKNIYVARYDQGEPYFYVPWDLDGVFGTMWRGDKENKTDDILSNRLYDRLISDCSENGFHRELTNRWNNLRKNQLTHQTIIDLFKKNFHYLSENGIYEREENAWDQYKTDEEHMEYLSEWLNARLSFLDEAFNKPCVPHDNSGEEDERITIYPNPATDYLQVEIKTGVIPFELKIFNHLGQIVFAETWRDKLQTLNLSTFQPGMYYIRIQSPNFNKTKKLMIGK